MVLQDTPDELMGNLVVYPGSHFGKIIVGGAMYNSIFMHLVQNIITIYYYLLRRHLCSLITTISQSYRIIFERMDFTTCTGI